MLKLPLSFYLQSEVNQIAQQLLGKQLYTRIDGELTAGTIVETEAYNGVTDQASHAYGGRFTDRTKVLYANGGRSYVYLCYGIHHLFNVVVGAEGMPLAVLIRGLEPIVGVEVMLRRRNMSVVKPNLTAGPGALTKALGIDRDLNAKDLTGSEIWIADQDISYAKEEIVSVPRVGVDYAGDHALLPWRYYVKGNRFVSKPNT